MKVKNIIAEAFDATPLQGSLATLQKNYADMSKAISANPMLAKEFAPQLTTFSTTLSGLDKAVANMLAAQKADAMAASKQQQQNDQNNTAPGTTQSLAQQATPAATPIPTTVQKPVQQVQPTTQQAPQPGVSVPLAK